MGKYNIDDILNELGVDEGKSAPKPKGEKRHSIDDAAFWFIALERCCQVQLLVEEGFPFPQALKVATLNGALYLGREREIDLVEEMLLRDEAPRAAPGAGEPKRRFGRARPARTGRSPRAARSRPDQADNRCVGATGKREDLAPACVG